MVAAGVALIVHAQEARAQTYYVPNPGPPEGTATVKEPLRIDNNGQGQGVGGAPPAGVRADAFLYGGGVAPDLGAPGGKDSPAFGTDDGDQASDVPGASTTNRNASFYIEEVMKDWETLGGGPSRTAESINSAPFVGYEDLDVDNIDDFLRGTKFIRNAGTLRDATSIAYGTNNPVDPLGGISSRNGKAFEYADFDELPSRPFVDLNGVRVDLANLLPASADWADDAQAASRLGQIAWYDEEAAARVTTSPLAPILALPRPVAYGVIAGAGLLGLLVVSLRGQLRRKPA